MLSDEFLEKLFSDKRIEKVPLLYQSIMIHAMEEMLEKEGILIEKGDNADVRTIQCKQSIL